MLKGGIMFRNLDNQTQQTDRHHVSVMQRVLGVVGEEEHFAPPGSRTRAETGRRTADKALDGRTGARLCAPLHEVPEVRNAT